MSIPDISTPNIMNNCTVKSYIFTFCSVIAMDEIIFTWGLVIVAIINILLDKNWNRPKHVLGMEIFCAYKTVPIRHNTNFS